MFAVVSVTVSFIPDMAGATDAVEDPLAFVELALFSVPVTVPDNEVVEASLV